MPVSAQDHDRLTVVLSGLEHFSKCSAFKFKLATSERCELDLEFTYLGTVCLCPTPWNCTEVTWGIYSRCPVRCVSPCHPVQQGKGRAGALCLLPLLRGGQSQTLYLSFPFMSLRQNHRSPATAELAERKHNLRGTKAAYSTRIRCLGPAFVGAGIHSMEVGVEVGPGWRLETL